MKRFIWRVWFYVGLGGTISSLAILAVTKSLPVFNWFCFMLCVAGVIHGLIRILLYHDDPLTFQSQQPKGES